MNKKIILQTLVSLILVYNAAAQQGINYKAIINDTDGNVLVNTPITVRFTILHDGTTEVYKESHNPITDVNGIIIVNIGEGAAIDGAFDAINWGSAPHYLKTEIDKGEGFVDMGTTEFKTVPYALHAKTAGNTLDLSNFEEGDILQYNGSSLQPAVYSFYYQDNDGDGLGNDNVFVYSPVIPPNFVAVGGDVDDSNPIPPDIPNTSVDIILLIDNSAGMGGVIGNIRNSFLEMASGLKSTISDLSIGLATFQDFPISPFGQVGDIPYRLLLPVTNDFNNVFQYINNITASGGGDEPESGNEALYQIATGEGISNAIVTISPSNAGFRDGSVRIVILITNAIFHDASDYQTYFEAHSKVQALDVLTQSGLSVISMNVGADPSVRDNLISYAVATNATIPSINSSCPTGLNGSSIASDGDFCSLVFDLDSNGGGISDRIITSVLEFLDQ